MDVGATALTVIAGYRLEGRLCVGQSRGLRVYGTPKKFYGQACPKLVGVANVCMLGNLTFVACAIRKMPHPLCTSVSLPPPRPLARLIEPCGLYM